MATFCVDISLIPDAILEQFGYRLIDENDEFKRYEDKYMESHLVQKVRPLLFVEDINDSVYLAASKVIALPDDIDD